MQTIQASPVTADKQGAQKLHRKSKGSGTYERYIKPKNPITPFDSNRAIPIHNKERKNDAKYLEGLDELAGLI